VVRIGETLAAGERERGSDGVPARVARTVDGAVHGRGLASDALHHVDLAAARPAVRLDVGPEQPEHGPDPLAFRELEPGLETGSLTIASSFIRLWQRGQARTSTAKVRAKSTTHGR